jgi:putative addiction module component (TIGR02574 family)
LARSCAAFDASARTDYIIGMSSAADRLEQEIKSLPDLEKVRLVESILADLEKPDPEIDRIWAEEAQKRWAAYKAGKISTVSYEEVMSRHRKK